MQFNLPKLDARQATRNTAEVPKPPRSSKTLSALSSLQLTARQTEQNTEAWLNTLVLTSKSVVYHSLGCNTDKY